MKMKLMALVIMASFIIGISATAQAAGSATQSFSYQVNEVSEITVSTNPGNLVINTAVAGSDPTGVSDSSTSYAITANGTNKKITGQITTGGALPTGVTLTANLLATGFGTGGADVDISDAAVHNLVTGITKAKASQGSGNTTITYKLNATTAAGTVGPTAIVVTLTITN